MDRPQYQLLKKVAEKGSKIYIKSLDRLGRNKEQIKQEQEYFKSKGVRVKILDIPQIKPSVLSLCVECLRSLPIEFEVINIDSNGAPPLLIDKIYSDSEV